MKIDVGRSPSMAMRCDLYLEGENDPPFVRIIRNGVVVAEVAVGAVSDAETMAREIENARRLELFPARLHRTLSEMSGDYAGFPDDGDPQRRREQYARGFLAGLRAELKGDLAPKSQTWLAGYVAAKGLLEEANALTMAYRDTAGKPSK